MTGVLAMLILAALASSGVSTSSTTSDSTSTTTTGPDIVLGSASCRPDRMNPGNLTFRVVMINIGNVTESATLHVSVNMSSEIYTNSATVTLVPGEIVIYPLTVTLPEITNETRLCHPTAEVWLD